MRLMHARSRAGSFVQNRPARRMGPRCALNALLILQLWFQRFCKGDFFSFLGFTVKKVSGHGIVKTILPVLLFYLVGWFGMMTWKPDNFFHTIWLPYSSMFWSDNRALLWCLCYWFVWRLNVGFCQQMPLVFWTRKFSWDSSKIGSTFGHFGVHDIFLRHIRLYGGI